MTAGKIIPAIATTTCMITGLVALEFYKVVLAKPLEALRNSFVNLAVNVYSMGEPAPPKRTKSVEFDVIACGPVRALPEGWSRWDKVVCREGNLTCAQFEEWLSRVHGVKLNMVTCGKTILYNPMLYKAHRETRAAKPLKALFEELTGARLGPKRTYLVLDASVYDDASDVMLPPIQFYFE
jgi:ubiquitin-activating enzyme E1